MLGKIINGYQIIACAYLEGNADDIIVIQAKRPNEERYITGTMISEWDAKYYNVHNYEDWDAADKSWQDFISRANSKE